jgi:hypothetical protein
LLRFLFAQIQFLEVEFGGDENFPIEFFLDCAEYFLEHVQHDLFGTLLLLLRFLNHTVGSILQDLVVLANESDVVGTDVDDFIEVGGLLFNLVAFHRVKTRLVEIGQLVDKVGVELEDQVQIADPPEDKRVEEMGEMLEVGEILVHRQVVVIPFEVIEVEDGLVLQGMTDFAVTGPQR